MNVTAALPTPEAYEPPAEPEKYHDAPPCPICNGTDLGVGMWCDDAGEYDAIECQACLCSAPASVWMARAEIAAGASPALYRPGAGGTG